MYNGHYNNKFDWYFLMLLQKYIPHNISSLIGDLEMPQLPQILMEETGEAIKE